MLRIKLVVPRVMERLARVLEVPLTLVAAPARYGKTTLLTVWARSQLDDEHRAWLDAAQHRRN